MDDNYPAPTTPLSFREVLQKATRDSVYADFIHAAVRRARTAESDEEKTEALAVVDAHFKLSGGELTTLGLPQSLLGRCNKCTNTNPTLFMLDLATATARFPSEQAG